MRRRSLRFPRQRRTGFTLLEAAISLAVVTFILAIILPVLSSARVTSYRTQCADNQRRIGEAWMIWLAQHDGAFPVVGAQPAWQYGGARFSSIDGQPFLDTHRPLSPFLPAAGTPQAVRCFCCPADQGITGPMVGVGTGRRTAFRSFGTSYRANADLLGGRIDSGVVRPLRQSEIVTIPSRLVLLGDAVWYEARESTGREADWHAEKAGGNLLFLDGSVKFTTILPRPAVGSAVFEAKLADLAK